MRKYLGIILAMTLILSLAACGDKDTEPDEQQPIPTGIENEETAFHKALVPVKYREEEEVQSTYYKTVFENDEAYYEVQPDKTVWKRKKTKKTTMTTMRMQYLAWRLEDLPIGQRLTFWLSS